MYNRSSNAYDVYQENDIMTAPQGKLLLMLYDGAAKFLRFAKISIDEGDIQKANENILKAQDIISELMITLNMDVDIAKDLYSLYDYMKYRLIQANIKKDKEIIDEVLDMLNQLKEAWKQII
jgi:flagellar protein FliS